MSLPGTPRSRTTPPNSSSSHRGREEGTPDGAHLASGSSSLTLASTIGFGGNVANGLHVHPDRKCLIYPIGCNIIVEDIETAEQSFLSGHSDLVTCVDVSRSGRLVASGQVTHMGFKADVIVWEYDSLSKYAMFSLHKVKVEALAISPTDKYLATLGGKDDNSVVIWDLEKKEALCGSHATLRSDGPSLCVAFSRHEDSTFITGGNKTLRVWSVDAGNRKIHPTDVNMGQMKRIIRCMVVAEDDKFAYCGTTTGDVLEINIKTCLLQSHGPLKELYGKGVQTISLMKTGELLVGCGDGTIGVLKLVKTAKSKEFKRVRKTKVNGAISSIAIRGEGHQLFVGTQLAEIHCLAYLDFSKSLLRSCHASSVTDITFPWGCSDLFATSSRNDIRVWNLHTGKELLRVTVPNMTCNCMRFMEDGKSIVSGWDDGKLRAFYPESGRPMYTIHDAHANGVTAMATTNNSQRIISGGGEGQVRIWNVSPTSQRMQEAMKEHKGAISCIQVSRSGKECVSASEDGTCIIWNLERFVRNQVIFATTLFKAVNYHPSESQLLTTGTDRKVGYWETFDGSQIRELEASTSSINGMDIAPDGKYFATGGEDRLIKLWLYNEGEMTHLGVGHSSAVTRLKICPKQRHVVSVSSDGSILCWNFPFEPLDDR